MKTREYVVKICDGCITLVGSQCYTPECAFCRKTTKEIEALLEACQLRYVVDGEIIELHESAIVDVNRQLENAIQRAARLLSLCEFDQPADMDDLEFIERVAKAPIRLACTECDRTDFDGIATLPSDWSQIGEAEVSENDSSWWTHLGLCPDCKTGRER